MTIINKKLQDKLNVLVLSPPNHPRRKIISEKLQKYNIPFTFVDGFIIRNEAHLKRILEYLGYEDIHTSFSGIRGNKGAMCAYVNAFKFIIDNKLDHCLLLEDDASIIDEGMQYFLLNIDKYLHLSDFFMIHSHILFATIAQIITLNGAKALYNQKNYIMYEMCELLDTAIWNNRVKGLNWNYADNFGLPPVFYQKEEFNDPRYSLRAQANEMI